MAKRSTIITGATVVFCALLCSGIVFADDDASVDDVSIVVPTACTLSGTGTGTHTATINPGQYVADIGTTTLKALCNDANGFAIYATGYTGSVVGDTNSNKLVGQNTAETIVTGLATSGNTSNWAMKLATDSTATYPVTIESAPNTSGGSDASFSSYHVVPNEYTKVATRLQSTDVGTTATGSTLTTTYATYISAGQVGDTYNGKVIYTLVHPNYTSSDALSDAVTVVYDGNGLTFPNGSTTNTVKYAEVCQSLNSCSMQAITGSYSETSTWKGKWGTDVNGNDGISTWVDDEFGGSGDLYDLTKEQGIIDYINNNYYSLKGTTIRFYAYNATRFEDVYAEANKSKTNGYYRIHELNGNMCADVTTGENTTVIDVRDNNTYEIIKLGDGNCWLRDNLALDPTDTTTATNMTSTNTNAPSDAIYNYLNGGNPNNISGWTSTAVSSPSDWNDSLTHPYIHNSGSKYYGNYYNYCAASIGTYCHDSGVTSTDSGYDLCPANWRLPTESEYRGIASLVSYNRTFKLVAAGRFLASSVGLKDTYGLYWTSTLGGYDTVKESFVYNQFPNTFGDAGVNYSYRIYGNSIRCVLTAIP